MTKHTENTQTQELEKYPEWLADEPDALAVLHAFVDKLDDRPQDERKRLPSIRLSPKLVPNMYHRDERADRTWALLRGLEGKLFEIRVDRKRGQYEPEYIGATLRFLEEAEHICRLWLDRPRRQPYKEEWGSAVSEYASVFSDGGTALMARPIKIQGKTAREVVGAFADIGKNKDSRLTLRKLSAKYFWGHSKVLDTREDLVNESYRELVIEPRPILVHVYLPSEFRGVLFIENLDTYHAALTACSSNFDELALVYVAGFRGSAERVRSREGASLHYYSGSCQNRMDVFEQWWFEKGLFDWDLWFWGDLDYSGMSILKILRQRFGDVKAWSDGYDPLLKVILDGGGHQPEVAEKKEQIDPIETGCSYADKHLLPAIRNAGRFIDQELFTI